MKTLLIIIALMFLLRFLMPYIIKFLLKAFVQKQMRKAQQYAYQAQQQQQHQQNHQQQGKRFYEQARQAPPTGKIKVDYVPQEQQQRKDFPGGEYVDYEEVK